MASGGRPKPHALRTLLTVLSGHVQWLREWAAARADPPLGQRTERMVTAAAQLTCLVEDLLACSGLGVCAAGTE